MSKYLCLLKQLLLILILLACTVACKKEQTANPTQNSPTQFIAVGYALTIYNGNLITDGYFSNNSSTYGVYQLNGATWSLMGAYTGYNSQINSITVYNGNLIMAGGFPYWNNGFVKMWNGSVWISLGSGFNNDVNALTVYNGNLIAGGSFDTTTGGPANYVAQWNGTSWQKLGAGFRFYSPPYSPIVNALTIYNGNLVAGGNFDLNGAIGIPTGGVAQWNGSTWSLFNDGVGGGVHSFASFNGNLIAGGTFKTLLGVDSSYNIAQWNGSAWGTLSTSKIGTGFYGSPVILTLTTYNGNLIVGGQFFSIGSLTPSSLAQWNGTSWSSPFGTIVEYSQYPTGLLPNPDVIYSSIVYNGSLVIGGSFNSVNGVTANGIALWNGSTWSAL